MENVTSRHSLVEKPLCCQCLIIPCHASGEMHTTVRETCFASFEKLGDIFSVGRKRGLDGRIRA